MIRTFDLKIDFNPIQNIGDKAYKICWDKADMQDPIYAELTPEEQAKEDTGEYVERTIIGYKDTDYCMFMMEYLYGDITINDIKNLIIDWYDAETKNKIITGMKYKGNSVYLSSENQHNFFDMQRIVNEDSSNLPIKTKIGEINNTHPIYYTFNTVEEVNEFCNAIYSHITQCRQEGWQRKDSIDWKPYEEALKT